MKVLILANSPIGLRNFQLELFDAIIGAGHELAVSVPDPKDVPELYERDCRIIPTAIDRRGINPVKDLTLLRFYKKLLRSEKPDVVLTYTVKPNVYGGYACRRAGVPYISTIAGLGTAFQNEGLLKKLVSSMYKAGLKKADAVVFLNEANRQVFASLGIGRNYCMVPGAGVNTEKHPLEPYPEAENVRFLYIGRIMKEKGVYEMADAMRIIRKKHPETALDMIGWYDDDCRGFIEDLESDGTAKWHGYTERVHDFIKSAHATVLASYHEGISTVLLESASAGRPVLASDIPGCRETFTDGVSGISFDPHDPESIAAAMERFISMTNADRAEMGKAGRRKMEREFDRRIVVDRYMELIEHSVKN